MVELVSLALAVWADLQIVGCWWQVVLVLLTLYLVQKGVVVEVYH